MASSNNSNTGHPCVDRDRGGPNGRVQGKMVACSTAQQQNRAGADCQNPQPPPMHPARPDRAGQSMHRAAGQGPGKNRWHTGRPEQCKSCVNRCAKRVHAGSFWRETAAAITKHARGKAQGACYESHIVCLCPGHDRRGLGCGWDIYARQKQQQRQHHAAAAVPLGCCERDYGPADSRRGGAEW